MFVEMVSFFGTSSIVFALTK